MSCRVVLGPTKRLRLAAVRIQVYWPFLAAGTPRHALLSRDLSLSWLQILAESLFPPYFLYRSLSAHPGTVRALLISAYKQWVWAGDSQASA